jgi:hypothetical protein
MIVMAVGLAYGQSESRAHEQERYLHDQEHELRREYRMCTGDTTTLHLPQLLRWKKDFHDTAQTDEYKRILAQYITETGLSERFNICDVLAWQRDRIARLAIAEEAASRKLLDVVDTIIDSVGVQNELQLHPPSRYDFDTIPFGASLRGVRYFLLRVYKHNPVWKYPCLRVDNLPMAGELFTVAFFFDKKESLRRWEIQGRSLPADSLDATVRRQAAALSRWFSGRLGEPHRSFRVGRFDIKPQQLSAIGQWQDSTHTADIGIGAYAERFYAKAIVTLNQPAAPPPSATLPDTVIAAPDSSADSTGKQ